MGKEAIRALHPFFTGRQKFADKDGGKRFKFILL